ncbi:tyrosine-type recombinase/integrase [Afipia clevelandensis]|uniref:Tyr recombinase domain-containing protein n=1 Tax=Afipia clevelandensis ATCC 49720 TaxID=883079 RepID=K8P2L6_9BRAD|nr:tyrosine-type recombinase/integrase [Afipia clevelandensis]EKS32673.1 hypothetical protein HMPREF9696_03650 [Afipia clevelandensis ATCC 49720]
MSALKDVDFRHAEIREKPYKIFDGGGLHLYVTPQGSRLWRLAYRFNRKQKLLSLGAYPVVSLADARQARIQAKRFLSQGQDPSEVRREERETKRIAASNDFSSIAKECLQKWKAEGQAEATLVKKEWLLDFVIRDLGHRPIAEITARELLAVLKKIESTGRYETASRVRSTVGAVFRYAIASARAERDVSADLRDALTTPKVRHHPGITDPHAIGGLLRAIDGFDGHSVTRIALKLAPLLFLRPGELRSLEWSEIDVSAKLIRVSANKTKLRRDHICPLSRQAMKLIEEIREISGESRYLFPSLRSWHRPMSENTLNGALRRLGYSGDEMTAHGFRSMASTRLNESGKFAPDVIERQLAHIEQNEVRRAYNAAQHMPERVLMMQYWADYLDDLRQQDLRKK